ncbi:MAG TPA: hypothetical protein VND40_01515 [Nitrososphaerales archaeon]|nr:hypothetical protein [Nitrososphaerales archaeon]
MEPGRGERPKRPEFEAILEQSIENGLRNILGESGFQMVISQYPLNRISTDPAMFHKIMKDIFMESGAAIIEREVARRLLEGVGDERRARGRSHHSWLAAASNGKASGRVSKKEKEVLRQFLALESLSEGHPAKAKAEAPPMDLTATTFAYAFKKGT